MKKIMFVLFSCLSLGVSAQRLTIKGVVSDSAAKPLDFATVMLLNPQDSSLLGFDRTNEAGVFELKNLAPANYLLKITYVGHNPFTKSIDNQAVGVLDLGNIQMKAVSKELAEIVIEGEKAPVTFKRDTIEFNAGSFKTKPNAAVEDLLKKLPGVQVERDGSVKVQGQQVQRVMVDGKDFFGRDPKIATQNLPADAVDKVQVFDRKSDQAVFSGIDDGQREKTINLELKEKHKKGAFGNFMAGLGSNERFESKMNLNRFTQKSQISLIGMGNNVNQQGFSIDEYINFTGGLQRAMGGGGAFRLQIDGDNQNGMPLNFGGNNFGLMRTLAGGLNFNHQFSKKTEINGSYFYNQLNNNLERELTRQNFLPNGTFNFNQNNLQNTQNDNHRLNLTLEHKIDSVNSIRFTTAVNYNQTRQNIDSENQTLNSNNVIENEGERNTQALGTGFNMNSSLLYRHKFKKKGRTFSTNFNFILSENDNDGALQAVNRYFGNNTITQNFNQTNTQINDNQALSLNVSYTEPIAKRMYLEANYNFRKNLNQVNREVFDIENENPIFNPLLSNKFNSDYTFHRPGMNFRINRKKYNFATGLSFQNTRLVGNLLSLNAKIDRSFSNILPNIRFNYDFSNSKHLNINYETSVREPSVNQLQPVVNNADPLNIYIGNPNLRPEYQQQLLVNFMTFDAISNISFFANLNAVYSSNSIVESLNIDEQFVRTTTPVNVANNSYLNGNLSFGFPIKKLKSRINIGSNANLSRGINLLNNLSSFFYQQGISGNARYEFRPNDNFDFSLSADLRRQNTIYQFSEARNQSFLNQTYTAETNLTLPWKMQFNSLFDFLIFKSQSNPFTQKIPLWNISWSKFFLKGQAGELKLSVVNILNRNVGATQNASLNFVEQERIRSLGRYFMVSFTYALNKALNPTAGRRGMMRIIRQ
jgi:hypothetical protein